MTKIFHWVFGSFFRTLGRILGYLLIGFILALILSNSKLPKISDIFTDIAFMKVNASTYVESVHYAHNQAFGVSNSDVTSDSIFFKFNISNNNNIFQKELNLWNIDQSANYDYAQFNILYSQPDGSAFQYSIDEDYCTQWDYRVITTQENVLSWDCQKYDTNSNLFKYYKSTTITNANFTYMVTFTDGTYSMCEVNNTNYIMCPVNHKTISTLRIYSNFNSDYNTSFTFGLNSIVSYFNRDSSSQQIINNQNQNTQSIISNQNQNNQAVINNQNANTNATIENQNQNTQQQIQSQQVCKYIDKNDIKKDNYYLDQNGVENQITSAGVTDYINIQGVTIKNIETYVQGWAFSTCYYNVNKEKISCILNQNLNSNIPANAVYLRATIHKGQNKPTFEICQNGNQAMANTITDESAPSNLSSISNDSLVGYLPPGPVDSLLNLPLVLLNSLQNALSSSCSPITLTLPFVNSDIVLPCMSTLYESMGVSSFVNWAGIIASAFILFSYLMRFYKWVDNTLTFRENNWLDNWGGE